MRIILLSFALAVSNVAVADSLVLGRVVKSGVLESAGACEEDDSARGPDELESICMYGWWRWTIDVRRVVGGTKVPRRVLAARIQHTDMLPSYQKMLRLFVLEPIEDPGQRKKLHADYYLVDTSSDLYCISQDPETFGLSKALFVRGSGDNKEYCFHLHAKDEEG